MQNSRNVATVEFSARTAILSFFLCATALSFSACAPRSDKINETRYTKDVDSAFAVYQQGDCSRSAALFSDLLKQAETPSALQGLGLSFAACGESESALLAFKKAAALAPGVAEFRVNYAQTLFALGDREEAGVQYDAALSIDPGNVEASMGKAAVYLQSGKTEEALPILSRLQQRRPDMPQVQFNRAIAMYQLGLYTDAEMILSGFLQQWPDDPEAWNAFGVVHLGMNEAQKALADFSRAIELNANSASYYFNRGDSYRSLKKLQEAKDDYTRSILYATEPAGAYLNRGEVRFLLGEKEEACVDLQRACDLGLCERLEYYRKAGQCRNSSL